MDFAQHYGIRISLPREETESIWERMKNVYNPHVVMCHHVADKDCPNIHSHIIIPSSVPLQAKETFRKTLIKRFPELAGGKKCERYALKLWPHSWIRGLTYFKHEVGCPFFGSPEAKEAFDLAPAWVDKKEEPKVHPWEGVDKETYLWEVANKIPPRHLLCRQLTEQNIEAVMDRHRFFHFNNDPDVSFEDCLGSLLSNTQWRIGRNLQKNRIAATTVDNYYATAKAMGYRHARRYMPYDYKKPADHFD